MTNLTASPATMDSLPQLPSIKMLNKAFEKKSKTLQAEKISDHSDKLLLIAGNSRIKGLPGIAVFEYQADQSVEFIWHHPLDYGDGILNTLSFLDFNQDGLEDILVCLGDESNFFTHIFINQGDNNFVRAYHEYGPYPTIVDLDGDNRPELLINSYNSHEKEFPFEYSDPDAHNNELNAIYLELAGAYKDDNCFYNPDYPRVALHLYFPIKIMEFEQGQFVETTKRYPKHIKKRVAFLNSLKPRLAEEERDGLMGVVKQLEKYY